VELAVSDLGFGANLAPVITHEGADLSAVAIFDAGRPVAGAIKFMGLGVDVSHFSAEVAFAVASERGSGQSRGHGRGSYCHPKGNFPHVTSFTIRRGRPAAILPIFLRELQTIDVRQRYSPPIGGIGAIFPN
jgi:hypothetical protein